MKLQNLKYKLRRLAFRRFFELFVIANYLIWLTVFSWEREILAEHGFVHFIWPRWAYIAIFACLSVLSIGCFRTTCRARFFAGYTMILGSLIWFKFSVNFGQLYPPLNASMFVYAVLSLFSAILGVYTIEKSRSIGGKDDTQ